MRPLAVLLAVAFAAPAAAQEEEEDDPAFARRPAAAEPELDPVPYTEEDPGLLPPGVTAEAEIERRAPRRPGRDPDDIGIGVRLSYRTVSIPEAAAPPLAGFPQEFSDDRFHGLALDVYPIAWYARVGLSTQIAFETDENDWLATEGLMVGLQRPSGRFTPFVEAGAQVGVARRTFYLFDQRIPAQTHLTLLWAFAGEVGVDARLGEGRTSATFSLGLQRTSFFYTTGDEMDKLMVKDDTAVALKIGIGY